MLEWIPDRPVLCHDKACTVDVLVRICPPREVAQEKRPELNLCLVIDRSGSMGGQKIEQTRQAAELVVRSLGPQDHLSIVLFDERIDVLLPAGPVTDKGRIIPLLAQITARGSTALFDGWKTGAGQACLGLDDVRLNRVVLLTDGQANVGITQPDQICDEVHRLSAKGVQTTTMGFGRDYNETLLRSMAASGEGNHFFVETPKQLPGFFELELEGLAATQGTRVRLKLSALAEGVVIEHLGEAELNASGAYQLADLTSDMPLQLLFRVTVPPDQEDRPCLSAELTWHSPRSGNQERLEVPLQLPRVTMVERLAMPVHPEVENQLALAMAARSRREAMNALNRGDRAEATRILQDAMDTRNLPEGERKQLEQLKQTAERGDQSVTNKLYTSQSYAYSRGSVVLTGIELDLIHGMITSGAIPVRLGALFQNPPAAAIRPWSKVAGMMGGLFAGEALGRPAGAPRGESGELSLVTLKLLGGRKHFLNAMAEFGPRLAEAPVADCSQSFADFRRNVQQGATVFTTGVAATDCGALGRIAPLLLGRWGSQDLRVWTWIVAGAHLTHNRCISTVSCLGFAALLMELMTLDSPPPPHFYLTTFLQSVRDLELDEKYPAQAPRYDGWSGKLSEFLEMVIPDARRRGLSAPEAHAEWGSGAYLLECVPTLLYILESHAHQPLVAIRQATSGTQVPAFLGALVGAALGALHGALPGFELRGEAAQALAEVAQRFSVTP